MTNIIFTAYCACKLCCGAGAANLTASGEAPREGITVAAARSIPIGTKVSITIPGSFTNRVFTVQDRLAKRFDSRVDIFFTSHKRALSFGKQHGSLEITK